MNGRHLWKLWTFIVLYFSKTKARGQGTQKKYATLPNPKMYPHTKFWILTSHNIQILSGLDLFRAVARGQGHRDMKSIGGTPWPIDVSTYQILYHIIKKICSLHDFYTTKVRGQGHSSSKVGLYNLNNKMHPHTKFEIVTSNNVGIQFFKY